MNPYGNPLAHMIPLIVTTVLLIGTGIMLVLTSEIRYTHNPIPERPHNCLTCVAGTDSQHPRCRTCRGYSNHQCRV